MSRAAEEVDDIDEDATEQHIEDSRMSLVDHLRELKSRLSRALIAFGVAFAAAWFIYTPTLEFILRPYRKAVDDPDKPLYTLGLLEGFSIRLKVTAFLALAIALPVILWEIWRFISPGLKSREKRYAVGYVVTSMVLFIFGVAMAYVTAVPAFSFLLRIGGANLEPLITADKYVGFFIAMSVAFGVAFEFPVVLMFLVMTGALTSKKLLKGWRVAILIVTIVAAVITPSQDPITMLAMALPMITFYFAVILIAKFAMKR